MKINQPKNKESHARRRMEEGISLVELITVMAIIAVITVIAGANYRYGDQQMVLNNQANQFVQDLRKMQEWAMASHKVDDISRPGYGIYVTEESRGSYLTYVEPLGTADGQYKAGEDDEQQTIVLNGNVEIFDCEPDNFSVNYTPPEPKTKIKDDSGVEPGSGQAVVTLRLKNNPSVTRQIVINKAGLVYVK